MKETLKNIYSIVESIKLQQNFKAEFSRFKQLAAKTEKRFCVLWKNRYPCLKDKTTQTSFDRHYIYHTAWAARVLNKIKPTLHTDISSSIQFCSIISAFIPTKFYDYRPVNLNLDNFSSEPINLLSLPFEDKSINSLSCMHVVEHVGLARYGDSMDPDGDLKAISELKRVLAINGSLLFVVPIGKPKLMFNAHRIYSYEQVMSYFSELELKEFTLIPDRSDDQGLIYNAQKEIADKQTYGCGCFWFMRINRWL